MADVKFVGCICVCERRVCNMCGGGAVAEYSEVVGSFELSRTGGPELHITSVSEGEILVLHRFLCLESGGRTSGK